jgi:hypothetical protein
MVSHMSSPAESAADAELYCEFGRTMRAAQTFEYTVRQLVSLDELLDGVHERSRAETGDEIDRFFKRPLAKLAKLLGIEERVAEELQAAVATRNTLAHEYLITAFLELHVGIADHQELIATLRDAQRRYDDLNARLDSVVDERHRQLGINPDEVFDTPEKMRRAMLGDEQ